MSTLTWEERVDLAQRFAPRLIVFPDQQQLGKPKIEGGAGDYQPRTIELLLDRGRLYPGTLRSIARLQFLLLFNYLSRPPATLDNLGNSRHSFDQIRLLGPAIPNPERAWASYFEILKDRADQFPVTTYAHVLTRAEALEASQSDQLATLSGLPFYTKATAQPDDVVVQYWFCYYFDDWVNVHEGDWEGISIFLHRTGDDWNPLGATYYAHENGARRHWGDMEIIKDEHGHGEHPVVYVASGSHASYFQYTPDGHNTQLSGYIVAQLKLKVSFRINSDNRDYVPPRGTDQDLLIPRVEVLPDPVGPRDQADPAWRHLKWLSFPGSWGARELGRFIAGGPTGPSQKGLKWTNPFAWSEDQCWPDYLIY